MNENNSNNTKKTSKKKKMSKLGIKNMGINIDKNEYYEIILSNSNHPDSYLRKERGNQNYWIYSFDRSSFTSCRGAI